MATELQNVHFGQRIKRRRNVHSQFRCWWLDTALLQVTSLVQYSLRIHRNIVTTYQSL